MQDLEKPCAKPTTQMILKRFDHPDEVREMEMGRFELVRIGGMSIGLALEPRRAWRGQKMGIG
jgi:hypothetical protein